MSRPGFVLDVDERTPALLVPTGTGARLERFGLGTRVLYPGDADVSGSAVDQIDAALASPLDAESLATQLRPGMKLTLTFGDVTSPVVPMKHDVRRTIIERVLEQAAAAEVDDVAIIAATGLRRHMTPAELTQLLGERIMRSFGPLGGVTNHDAEDADNLVEVADGVLVNRRVAEADLVVHVGAVGEHPRGGFEQLVRGGCGTATIAAFRGLDGSAAEPVAAILEAVRGAVPLFAVEAVVGQPSFTAPPAVASRGEGEGKLPARPACVALRRLLAAAPEQGPRAVYSGLTAEYEVLGVRAGAIGPVHEQTAALLADAQRVVVDGQADILVAGIGQPSSQAPESLTNPVIAAWEGLCRVFGSTTGTPVVREGGARVLSHLQQPRFTPRHPSAMADFFAGVLPSTTDPDEMAADYEQRFAADPWYIELYRRRHAFHPLQPFHLWYAIQPALQHLSDVVFVGADRKSAETMGFRAATTYADALEMLASAQGRHPSVTYLHNTGGVLADVRTRS